MLNVSLCHLQAIECPSSILFIFDLLGSTVSITVSSSASLHTRKGWNPISRSLMFLQFYWLFLVVLFFCCNEEMNKCSQVAVDLHVLFYWSLTCFLSKEKGPGPQPPSFNEKKSYIIVALTFSEHLPVPLHYLFQIKWLDLSTTFKMKTNDWFSVACINLWCVSVHKIPGSIRFLCAVSSVLWKHRGALAWKIFQWNFKTDVKKVNKLQRWERE